MSKKQPKFYWRLRCYPDSAVCDVWMIRRDGAALSGLLHSAMLRDAADEMIAATGLTVTVESSVYDAPQEQDVPPAKQRISEVQPMLPI